jgi:hypothetical protein
MSIHTDLRKIIRLLRRLLDSVTGAASVQITFLTPENDMSNTVTLNANAVNAQTSQATATNNLGTASYLWASDNTAVATVDITGLVTGVADPSGSGTNTCNITATIGPGNPGAGTVGTGVVTVVTTATEVTVTIDFGPPTP